MTLRRWLSREAFEEPKPVYPVADDIAPAVRPLQAVIVSAKTGQSIKGVLLDTRPDALVLRAAAVATVEQNGSVAWNALDGDVVIPMENIDFYQSGLDAAILDSLEDRKRRRRAS